MGLLKRPAQSERRDMRVSQWMVGKTYNGRADFIGPYEEMIQHQSAQGADPAVPSGNGPCSLKGGPFPIDSLGCIALWNGQWYLRSVIPVIGVAIKIEE